MDARLAVFTIVRDEPVWSKVWLGHYLRHVPASNIYVLDHDSQPGNHEFLMSLAVTGLQQPIIIH